MVAMVTRGLLIHPHQGYEHVVVVVVVVIVVVVVFLEKR
jgi:hypothetical protein